MSSLHPDVSIEANEKKTLETIAYYNKTKYGVNALDQIMRHSTTAASRRWPVHAFYNILDIAGVNSYIIYKAVTNKKISRKTFLQNLAEDLRSEYMKTRSSAQEAENDMEKDDVTLETTYR